jgi:hypothetical protein
MPPQIHIMRTRHKTTQSSSFTHILNKQPWLVLVEIAIEREVAVFTTDRPTDDAAPIIAPIGGLSEADRAAIQKMQQRLVYVHLQSTDISDLHDNDPHPDSGDVHSSPPILIWQHDDSHQP